MALSPDGRTLAVAGFQAVKVWDLDKPQQRPHTFAAAEAYRSLALARSGTHLAAGGYRGEVTLWDLNTGRPTHWPRAHQGQVEGLAFSPDGKTLASAANAPDRSIKFWEVETGKEKFTCPDAFQGAAFALAYFPDGKTLLSGSFSDGKARLWDASNGRLLHEFPEGSGFWAAVRPDGRQFAMTSTNRLRLWNAETRTEERSYALGPPFAITRLAYTPDGWHVLTGNGNGTLYLLRTNPGRAAVEKGADRNRIPATDGRRAGPAAAAPVAIDEPPP